MNNPLLPKFSVLLSLYNGESVEYFSMSMDSLFHQTLPADEIILVIDGPIRKELEDVLTLWSSKLPIIVVRLEKNLGLSNALNKGLEYCTYDLVARMDTDDICTPNRFTVQVAYMAANRNVDICGSFCSVISELGEEYDQFKVPTYHNDIVRLVWSCPMIHPSVIFRKNRIQAIGGYSTTIPLRQDDYELWIRAAINGLYFANIPKNLIYYRLSTTAYTKNTLSVSWNRLKIGLPAVGRFDCRIYSYLALCFPIFRALMPNKVMKFLKPLIRWLDPRN